MDAYRLMAGKLKEYAAQFRAIALMGPRQSGKTTLAKMLFPERPYINFENLDVQLFAAEDPKGFLYQYRQTGAILDEVQKVPQIFNYLQQLLDEEKETGKYILTGSSNFLLNEKISQSLAGRVGYLSLFPFAAKEITTYLKHDVPVAELVIKGGYPEVWVRDMNPAYYYNSYIQSIIEKDIRQLLQINNLATFQVFVKLCATRAAQEWNHLAIATELGIDSKTVQAWLSLLQSTGIIQLVSPYYTNYGKRLIKRPRLYFNDTGVLCNLLGIGNIANYESSPMKGPVFENFVFTEINKYNELKNFPAQIFYWRAISGIEIDLILENNFVNTAIEIKAGSTYQPGWWKNIDKWKTYDAKNKNGIIIYGGEENFTFSDDKKVMTAGMLYEKFAF